MILILLLILSLTFPALSGLLLVSLCSPILQSKPSFFWARLWLSIGTGVGIASINLTLSTLLAGSVSLVFIVGELIVLSALIATRWYLSNGQTMGFEPQTNQVARRNAARIVTIPFFALFVLQALVFVLISLRTPHSYGDAMGFWNARARFLFRAGIHWRDVVDLLGGLHADYPFLLSETVVRFWSYAGRETIVAAPLTAFLFTFGTVGLLVASLSALRGSTQGFVGGLFLLGTPFFISHGASQYADVPFGFYLLAAIALFNFSDEFGANRGLLALSGLMAALAAWTKNEGLLFLFTFVVSWILTEIWQTRRVGFGRGLLAFVGGALPVIVLTISFKAILATKNDLLAAQGGQSLKKLMEIARYLVTFNAFLRQTLRVSSIPLGLLPFYAMLLGLESSQLKRPALTISCIALLLMFLGYFFVFVSTPYDLAWHLDTSLDRLFLQLWPSTIFVFLMIVTSPAKLVLGKRAVEGAYARDATR
jgi:hypothetical protein